jgi:hypothetical protein
MAGRRANHLLYGAAIMPPIVLAGNSAVPNMSAGDGRVNGCVLATERTQKPRVSAIQCGMANRGSAL